MSEASRPREEPDRRDAAASTEPPTFQVTVRRRPDEAPVGAADLGALGISLAGAAGASAALGPSLGLLLAVAAAHVALVRPAFRTAARLHADRARLRAALACPYCKDALGDEAVGCDRAGCGALYHRECWDECRESYGGCAVYGCGCTTTRELGRFALRRRALRLLLAAALFPPRVVRRLRGGGGEDGKSLLRWAWDEAVAVQENASASCGQSLLVGGVNLGLCALLASWLQTVRWIERDGATGLIVLAAVTVAAVTLMRLPLLTQLTWNLLGVFTDALASEVVALARADAGDETVLGRLARGAGGKKA